MKLGITKQQLPEMAQTTLRYFGGMIAGAGIGMFLAVAFIPEDDRKIFRFHFFVTAWILICAGPLVANLAKLVRQSQQQKDLIDEKHVV